MEYRDTHQRLAPDKLVMSMLSANDALLTAEQCVALLSLHMISAYPFLMLSTKPDCSSELSAWEPYYSCPNSD